MMWALPAEERKGQLWEETKAWKVTGEENLVGVFSLPNWAQTPHLASARTWPCPLCAQSLKGRVRQRSLTQKTLLYPAVDRLPGSGSIRHHFEPLLAFILIRLPFYHFWHVLLNCVQFWAMPSWNRSSPDSASHSETWDITWHSICSTMSIAFLVTVARLNSVWDEQNFIRGKGMKLEEALPWESWINSQQAQSVLLSAVIKELPWTQPSACSSDGAKETAATLLPGHAPLVACPHSGHFLGMASQASSRAVTVPWTTIPASLLAKEVPTESPG